jgi:hypothetical protein
MIDLCRFPAAGPIGPAGLLARWYNKKRREAEMSSLRTFDRPGRRLVPGPTLPAPPVPETHQIARAAAHLLVTSGLCLALVSWAVPDT